LVDAVRPPAQIAALVGMAVCVCVLLFGLFGHPLRDRNRVLHGAAASQVEAFLAALEHYKVDCKQYPTTIEGLDALASNPGVKGWRGPYLTQDIPLDPWGNQYRYEYSPETERLEIKSYGADGKPGGLFFDADISSLNLHAVIPESPFEAKSRRLLIGSTIGSCIGLLASFLLWGFASRRDAEEEAEEGL
jgi:type II secretion system protein G